jgi:1,4-dihydroxy-2-naphthoate polyprenyltransferase
MTTCDIKTPESEHTMSFIPENSRLGAWYSASRPRTLTATYAPMGVAAAVAIEDEVFALIPFVLALIGALFLQIAANLINEYFDYTRGMDTHKQAGQGMTIKEKVLSPRAVFIGAVVTVLAGSLIGLYLLSQSGPLLWWIGIGGVLVVVTYTAGPFPLAYYGLGEIAVGIFMGPGIVVGAYYVMDTHVYWELALISTPIAFMVAAILHANNIRDMDADRAVNKHTLATMFGIRFARAEYAFLVGGTYVTLGALILAGFVPPLTLLALVMLPEAYRLIRIFYTQTDTTLLHQAQGRTAKLHGQFALMMVVGWLLWLALGL